ncbi:MAG: DNA translocase FtsK 4TM domain-containing protein, partial [Myxococcota bacterium]
MKRRRRRAAAEAARESESPRLVEVRDEEDSDAPAPAGARKSTPADNLPRPAAELSEDDPAPSIAGDDDAAPRPQQKRSVKRGERGNARATGDAAKKLGRKPKPHRSMPPRGVRAPLVRELMGVGLLALSLLSLLSLLSYSANDPGFGVTSSAKVNNLIGPFGAYLADGLTLLFGLGAFVVPAVLFVVGLFCFKPVWGRPRGWQMVGGSLLFLGIATFLDVVAGKGGGLPYPAGGLVGAVVAGVAVPLVHPLGAGILSVLAAAVGANLLIARPLGDTVNDIGRLLRVVTSYVREEVAIWWEKERLLREERSRLYEEYEENRRAQAEEPAEEAEAREQRRRERAEERARRKVQAEAERAERAAREAQEQPAVALPGSPAAEAGADDLLTIVTSTTVAADPLWANGGVTDPGGPPLELIVHEQIVDGKALALSSLRPKTAEAENTKAAQGTGDVVPRVVAGAHGKEDAAVEGNEGLVIVEREEDDAQVIAADDEEPEEKAEFILPPLRLLDYDAPEREPTDLAKLQVQAQKLLSKFRDFGIDGKVREVRPGPVCTTYEFVPAPGIKVSRIAALADDIAMAMEALHVRIVAPIPGKGAVGIEIPNEKRETVYLKEIVADPKFKEREGKLWMAMGKDIEGKPYSANLADMPHVLISGTTGSGKSVSVNAMICSLLYRVTPDEVKFLMIDPKMLELSIYEGIPHLLLPPITDSKKAAVALRWAVDEMERRYQAMSEMGVRDIDGFNEMVDAIKAGNTKRELPVQPNGKPFGRLPFIVIVVDEYADLLAVAGKDVEGYVMRLAQKARAAGLHVMLATQRPSVDVITGVIKANFPVRMGFRLASSHDSKT